MRIVERNANNDSEVEKKEYLPPPDVETFIVDPMIITNKMR